MPFFVGATRSRPMVHQSLQFFENLYTAILKNYLFFISWPARAVILPARAHA